MLPGKDGTTVTFILPSATSLLVSFPIRLNSIFLRAFITFPFLLTMFTAEVFFNPSQVTKCPSRIMMNTARLRAYINPFPNLSRCPLPQLPRQIMTSSMQLKILVSLKPFVTYLAHEPIRRHKRRRR